MAGEQGAALTHQLLAIARKQRAEPRPDPINEVVTSTSNLLQRLIGEQIELVISLDSALQSGAGLVLADPGQLRQVLMNLVLNAHDAMPHGGKIALEEKRVRHLRRQAEEDLAWKVEELARSNADLAQFAHVASHDLQEPLRMVASYTQLLSERYRGRLDADADKFIGYACEGAVRMKSLIQDLLAFSKVGRDDVTGSRIACDDVINEALLNLRTAIQERGAVITRGTLPDVWADRWQLARVFQNLIGNAIKFHGKESPMISVQAETSGALCTFSVCDNGIGVAPEYAEKVFVVFHRLHSRTEYAGNGIGLAICRKIIEHYGGKIWLEAPACGGSAFKFTLPCEKPN